MNPPDEVIEAAVAEAIKSPCAKSTRGAAVWAPGYRGWLSLGHNSQPVGFTCDGSPACRAACGKICEHAEKMALRNMKHRQCDRDLDMLHVKVVDGVLVASGPPSCWQCSRDILLDGRIAGVWLFHARHVDSLPEGWTGDSIMPEVVVEHYWRRYTALEFHQRTLETCDLPCATIQP